MKESAFIDLFTMEMNKVIVGQNTWSILLIDFRSRTHFLEGVPGLAKP
jgi:hypothetical protein